MAGISATSFRDVLCAPSPDDAAADFIMKRDDVPLPLPLGEKGHVPPVIATDSDGNPIE